MLIDSLTYVLNWWTERLKVGKSIRGRILLDIVSPLFSVVTLIGITIFVFVDGMFFFFLICKV